MKILNVINIKCMGCVNKIETALKEAGITGTVSLKDKKVVLKNDEDEEKARRVIEETGYKVADNE